MLSRDFKLFEPQQPAYRGGDVQIHDDAVTWILPLRRHDRMFVAYFQLGPRECGCVLECDAKRCAFSSKDGFGSARAHTHAGQIAMAVMHRCEPESTEQKGKAECQIVRVVHRTDEHR